MMGMPPRSCGVTGRPGTTTNCGGAAAGTGAGCAGSTTPGCCCAACGTAGAGGGDCTCDRPGIGLPSGVVIGCDGGVTWPPEGNRLLNQSLTGLAGSGAGALEFFGTSN